MSALDLHTRQKGRYLIGTGFGVHADLLEAFLGSFASTEYINHDIVNLSFKTGKSS